MKPELEDALRTTFQIAAHRREIRADLRQALKSQEDAEVVRCARRLMGTYDEDKGYRAPSCLKRGTSTG